MQNYNFIDFCRNFKNKYFTITLFLSAISTITDTLKENATTIKRIIPSIMYNAVTKTLLSEKSSLPYSATVTVSLHSAEFESPSSKSDN